MIATKTQPVQLDLGVTVLEESLWYLPNNSEGTVLGMDIMRKYGFVIHCFEKQIELKTEKTVKKCMSISTPDPIQQMVNKLEIRARDYSLSVVKVRAHIIKNPDENEKNNNIADQLAKLAAQKGDEWKPDRLVVPAVSAIQTIPIDLKQYQQELWSSDGELTPHLQQDQLVKVTEP